MGRKVHPFGFRIGTVRDWKAKWYSDGPAFASSIAEDIMLRKAIDNKYSDAGISLVEIERSANKVTVTAYTSRPGIVIGRGGQRVDEMRHYLEALIDKKIQLNIQEIGQPELDAYLVARSVADQIERRISYRRAMKQAISRSLQAGAQGVKIKCSGRLGGTEIARSQTMAEGRVPLHTLRADIDYGYAQAATTLGRIGIKVWIYRGDVLPELREETDLTFGESLIETEQSAKPDEIPTTGVGELETEEQPLEFETSESIPKDLKTTVTQFNEVTEEPEKAKLKAGKRKKTETEIKSEEPTDKKQKTTRKPEIVSEIRPEPKIKSKVRKPRTKKTESKSSQLTDKVEKTSLKSKKKKSTTKIDVTESVKKE
jgi:small subunit ribosomal protein S3